MAIDEDHDISKYICADCKNFFYLPEIGNGLIDGLNDPKFCPYCGTDFELILEIEEDEEEEE